ncbi:MAG: hypothetical protein JWP85_1633 [Rhodoglobus sp.]|jgi:hypothetical protein|nr:hypothetical protein [Rhodoglobus sp.]
MSLLAIVLTETEELAPLLMPPLAFAGIAVAVFLTLGFITWSFRDVANRHSEKTGKADSHGAGH